MAKSNNNSNSIAEAFVLTPDVLEKERQLHANLTSKSERIPFGLLYADYGRNIRIRQGTEVYGVKFNADTYDTDSLMMQIIEIGYVRDPLTVSKKTVDGAMRYEILRGFRRYDACNRIIQAGTNHNVIKALQEIPCNVYEGLTPEQENALINDQTSKQFMACEVLKEVWRRLSNGESWQLIGLHMAEQIERATGSHGKSAEIRKAGTQAEKLAIIQGWLNNTLNQYWQGVYIYGGPQVRKWLFLTYAEKDGLLGEKDEKPPFKLTSSVWNGKEGLQKAIREDMAAGQWDKEKGSGPQFDAAVIRIAESQKDKGKRNSAGNVQAKPGQTIQMMASASNRSEPIRQALESCLENSPTYQLDQWDAKINSWTRKNAAFNANRGILPPAVVELLSMAFDTSATPDDFDAKLASLVRIPTAEAAPVETVAEPATETAPVETVAEVAPEATTEPEAASEPEPEPETKGQKNKRKAGKK
jgi:hypothetical protein